MISVGATMFGGTSGSGTVTTTAGTTAAAGSTFYVSVIQSAAGAATFNITDSQSNTYTQIGTVVGNSNNAWLSRYQCVNGIGGAGHTVTATQTVGSDNVSAFAVEIVGGLTVTPPIDQSVATNIGFAGSPVSSGTVTVAPPVDGELLISTFTTDQYNATIPYTEANGFTIQQMITDGTAAPGGAVGTKIVTISGTYGASWGDGAASFYSASVDSFKGASTAVDTPLMGQICV